MYDVQNVQYFIESLTCIKYPTYNVVLKSKLISYNNQ